MPSPFNMMFMPGMGGPPQGAGANAGQVPMDPLQALFGGQGGGPNGAVDPALLQQLFGAAGGDLGAAFGPDGLFGQGPQQQEPLPRSGPPPTAAATLRTLPKIKVTAYDIAANEGSECSICLADLVAGEPALRIPCGHLFHEDCVKDWLKKSNECPVCRFELPTDDAEYERGRQTRMAGRKIRLRRADLDVKSVKELQRLAHFIAVDVKGCLEKKEIAERIAASPKVQIVQVETASDPAVSSSAGAQGQRAPTFSSSQLDAMSIGEVRAVMERFGIDSSGCTDKLECVARLALSGRANIVDDRPPGVVDAACTDNSPGCRDSGASPSASGPAWPAAAAPSAASQETASAVPLASRSVGELRRLAREHGVSLDGCLEKAEIVQRLHSAPALRGVP